jgi:hypothetical protein
MHMKKCSYCGREYPDDAVGCCEIDQTPLAPPDGVQAGSGDGQSPMIRFHFERMVVIASLACFFTLMFLYCAARPAASPFHIWWIELPACTFIPVAVAYLVLYRSGWRREIAGAARACSVLRLSCLILGGELLAVGILLCIAVLGVCMAQVGLGAISGGNH